MLRALFGSQASENATYRLLDWLRNPSQWPLLTNKRNIQGYVREELKTTLVTFLKLCLVPFYYKGTS